MLHIAIYEVLAGQYPVLARKYLVCKSSLSDSVANSTRSFHLRKKLTPLSVYSWRGSPPPLRFAPSTQPSSYNCGKLSSMAPRKSSTKASLNHRIDILNKEAVASHPASPLCGRVTNILTLVRVRTFSPFSSMKPGSHKPN